MIVSPPNFTLTYPLFPSPTLFRSGQGTGGRKYVLQRQVVDSCTCTCTCSKRHSPLETVVLAAQVDVLRAPRRSVVLGKRGRARYRQCSALAQGAVGEIGRAHV